MGQVSNAINLLTVVALLLPAAGAVFRILLNSIDEERKDNVFLYMLMTVIIYSLTITGVFSIYYIYTLTDSFIFHLGLLFLLIAFVFIFILIYKGFSWELEEMLEESLDSVDKAVEFLEICTEEYDDPDQMKDEELQEVYERVFDDGSSYNLPFAELSAGDKQFQDIIDEIRSLNADILLLYLISKPTKFFDILTREARNNPLKLIIAFPKSLIFVGTIVFGTGILIDVEYNVGYIVSLSSHNFDLVRAVYILLPVILTIIYLLIIRYMEPREYMTEVVYK